MTDKQPLPEMSPVGPMPGVMTRDEADRLYQCLRALCILKPGQALHVGGHVINGGRPRKVTRAATEPR